LFERHVHWPGPCAEQVQRRAVDDRLCARYDRDVRSLRPAAPSLRRRSELAQSERGRGDRDRRVPRRRAVRSDGEELDDDRAVEGNAVRRDYTAEGEPVTGDGNVAHFLAANTTLSQVTVIRLDPVGCELESTSAAQARQGLITAHSISNVDSSTDVNGFGHFI